MSNIKHRERFLQIVDFDGLKIGKGKPSDVDGVFDAGGKAFIVFELKSGNTPLPYGQRLLLQNMVDGWRDGGLAAAAIIARHDAPVGCDIDAAAAIVSDVWFNKRWYQVDDGATLRDMVLRFLSKHAPDELSRLTSAKTASQNRPGSTNGGAGDTRHGQETETPQAALQADNPLQSEGGERNDNAH